MIRGALQIWGQGSMLIDKMLLLHLGDLRLHLYLDVHFEAPLVLTTAKTDTINVAAPQASIVGREAVISAVSAPGWPTIKFTVEVFP